ncbi:shikimate kinase [Sporolactobacillus sp. THM7-4]|nr:shikimate kinase [Sporolactobacillus sp. THM7-4]
MIYITGFMGAGKTTIGAALGHQMNIPVYDTDELIEKEQKKSVQELFRENGETFFRNCESEILRKIERSGEQAIVTTGGGIITSPVNRELMRESGPVIFLYCDLEMIRQRLAGDQTRPLLQKFPGKELDLLYKKRLPDYLEATYTINATAKSVTAIVHEILSLVYQNASNWKCLK